MFQDNRLNKFVNLFLVRYPAGIPVGQRTFQITPKTLVRTLTVKVIITGKQISPFLDIVHGGSLRNLDRQLFRLFFFRPAIVKLKIAVSKNA